MSTGHRILEGYSARTSLTPLPSVPLYPFYLSLESLLPGSYKLSIFRSPTSFRSPTIESLRICCIIDSPQLTSEVKVIASQSASDINGKLKSLNFNVGIIDAGGVDEGTIRFYAEGLATSGGHLFDWCLEVEKTRTLPRLVLNPIERFGRGIWRASTQPIDYGVRPAIGAGMEVGKFLGGGGGKKKSVRWADTYEFWDGEGGGEGVPETPTTPGTPGTMMSGMSFTPGTPRMEDGLPVGILKGKKIIRRGTNYW